MFLLQLSRSLSTAESLTRWRATATSDSASIEPQSLDRGIERHVDLADDAVAASIEPQSLDRGISLFMRRR